MLSLQQKIAPAFRQGRTFYKSAVPPNFGQMYPQLVYPILAFSNQPYNICTDFSTTPFSVQQMVFKTPLNKAILPKSTNLRKQCLEIVLKDFLKKIVIHKNSQQAVSDL